MTSLCASPPSSSPCDAALGGIDDAVRTLTTELASTAIARDIAGGVPKHERDLLRASGLLKLTIPREFGGAGQPLSVLYTVVRDVARVDPALAHVFAFHHLMLVSVRVYASPAQWSAAYRETAAQNLFWGNALNPRDARTTLRLVGDGRYVLDGTKSFCSGAGDSDRLIVSALEADSQTLVVAMVPTCRAGIDIVGDWDAMGQRQTDSGTVEFRGLEVAEGELLRTPGPMSSVFSTLRSCISQAILVHVYLGIAEGAFAAMRDELLKRPETGGDAALHLRAGELWLELQSASALAERARTAIDEAWSRAEALSEAERAAAALSVALAKVASTRAGLSVTTRMFELMGARSALRQHGFDRYFRNLRTHTLHDPVDDKLRELGAFALTARPPKPGFYA